MGVFRRKVPTYCVPVHPDNIGKNDWVILLEAGTIVGPSAEKLRVATATLERRILTKYNILLRAQHFLVLEGYDPRIHTLYFCPQLYAYDSDNKLVALEGEEIGKLLAQAVQHGVMDRHPWYEPSDKVPNQPIIVASMDTNFDTLIVDRPRAAATKAPAEPAILESVSLAAVAAELELKQDNRAYSSEGQEASALEFQLPSASAQ
jgi:hypothetical protein